MLDSLVRVSRRVVKNHFANVRDPLEPYSTRSKPLTYSSQQAARSKGVEMGKGACLPKKARVATPQSESPRDTRAISYTHRGACLHSLEPFTAVLTDVDPPTQKCTTPLGYARASGRLKLTPPGQTLGERMVDFT
jgi:hypothetical protein